jgi:hypothetical protein
MVLRLRASPDVQQQMAKQRLRALKPRWVSYFPVTRDGLVQDTLFYFLTTQATWWPDAREL